MLSALSHPSAEHLRQNFHILSLNENLMLLFLRRAHMVRMGGGSAGGEGRWEEEGGGVGEGKGGGEGGMESLSLCPH